MPDHIIHFKQWKNKGYAVFSSIHKVITIGVLIVGYTLLTTSKGYTRSDTVRLEEVEVSGEKGPDLYSELSRIVSIMDLNDIQMSPVTSIQQILEYVAGVDVRQRGTPGSQADISIRGGNYKQVLVLLNNIPLNDPQTGHHHLNLPVNIYDIEKIEVLQGPGSRLYGPDAYTGAINIITRQYENDGIKLGIKGGQHGLQEYYISGTAKLLKSTHYISTGYNYSEGYKENTDLNAVNLYYRGEVKLRPGNFEFQAGHINKSFGAQNFYTMKFPSQFEQVRVHFLNMGFSSGSRNKFNTRIYFRRGHDRFELYREDPGFYTREGNLWISENDTALSFYKNHNYHMTDVYGLKTQLLVNSVAGRSKFGINLMRDRIFSNVIGETMDSVKAPGETHGFFNKRKSRGNISLFGEHNIYYKKLTLHTGIMANRNSEYHWSFSSGAEFSIRLNKYIRLFSSVNESMRLPNYTDLFYEDPVHKPNPNLKPEKAITYELGGKVSYKGLSVHVTFFRRKGKNLIDWVKDPSNPVLNMYGDTIWTSSNITSMNTNGFQTACDIPVHNLFSFKFIDFINVQYSNLFQQKESSHYLTAYVFDYLKHHLLIGGYHSIYDHWKIKWNYSFQNRAGYLNQNTGQITDYSPYSLFDINLAWIYKGLTTEIEINNLFNIEYRDYYQLEMPGRWIKVGILYEFDFLHDK